MELPTPPSDFFKKIMRQFLRNIEIAYDDRHKPKPDRGPKSWEWYVWTDKDGTILGYKKCLNEFKIDDPFTWTPKQTLYWYELFQDLVTDMLNNFPPEIAAKHSEWMYLLPEFHLMILKQKLTRPRPAAPTTTAPKTTAPTTTAPTTTAPTTTASKTTAFNTAALKKMLVDLS